MHITGVFLPNRLYCWVFEHDDFFVHDTKPTAQQAWCQRCLAWQPPGGDRGSWPIERVWPFTDRRSHPAGRRSTQAIVSTAWIEAPR